VSVFPEYFFISFLPSHDELLKNAHSLSFYINNCKKKKHGHKVGFYQPKDQNQVKNFFGFHFVMNVTNVTLYDCLIM
jgi:hypothetical protein